MEEEQIVTSYLTEPPKDLYEEYMTARAELGNVQTFQELYFKLMSLIKIGKVMLTNHVKLKKEIEDFLEDENNYHQARQMEYKEKENIYHLGPNTAQTGLIKVRAEDHERGLDEAKEQQSTQLVRDLQVMDNRILDALVDEGIIEIKSPSMEDVLMEDMMIDLQKKAEELKK